MKTLIWNRFFDLCKGLAVYYAIMILIVITVGIGVFSDHTISFGGYGFSIIILLFILGLICIREDVRLALQCGVGRRSAFWGNALTLLASSLTLSVAGEVLVAAAQQMLAHRTEMRITDLYHMLYVGLDQPTLTLVQHGMSILLLTVLGVFAGALGVFLSLLFWRLNRTGKIVAAVAIFALCTVVPMKGGSGTWRLAYAVGAFFLSSPWNLILTLTGLAAVGLGIGYFLLRKVVVRAAQ